MNKTEFLAALEQRLSVLPEADRKRSLLYFEEIIADRMEEGLAEEEVIAQMESVDEIANGIINDAMEEGATMAPPPEKKKVGGCPLWLAILLAVLASPIWLPVLVTLGVAVLILYLVPWILIGCMYIVAAALFFGGFLGIVAALMSLPVSKVLSVIFAMGASVFCIGFGILLVFPSVLLTRWYARGTVWFCGKVTSVKKGGKQYVEI